MNIRQKYNKNLIKPDFYQTLTEIHSFADRNDHLKA